MNKALAIPITPTTPVESLFTSDALVPITNHPSFDRTVEYLGVVNYGTTDRVIKEIKDLMAEDAEKEICLTITSAGGPSGIALSFYDHIHSILRPNLVTIGSGDVDSSGILLFVTGNRRYVTRHTTMLFHLAGRMFDHKKRYTADELRAMAKEDTLKDQHYADVVAKRSHGKLTRRTVLNLMKKNSVLTPDDLVRRGLADGILG